MSAEDQMWKIYLLEFIDVENNKMIQLFDFLKLLIQSHFWREKTFQ